MTARARLNRGKRLARAFGAWALLAGAALQTLKERAAAEASAAVADEDDDEAVEEFATQFAAHMNSSPLSRALRSMCAAHLVLLALRPLLETAAVYPAALACLPAVVAATLAYALTLGVAWAG